jgi:hypothetical protein
MLPTKKKRKWNFVIFFTIKIQVIVPFLINHVHQTRIAIDTVCTANETKSLTHLSMPMPTVSIICEVKNIYFVTHHPKMYS